MIKKIAALLSKYWKKITITSGAILAAIGALFIAIAPNIFDKLFDDSPAQPLFSVQKPVINPKDHWSLSQKMMMHDRSLLLILNGMAFPLIRQQMLILNQRHFNGFFFLRVLSCLRKSFKMVITYLK